uniref:Uncharacterized protein n=1 Tax=Arion vulgaris TaxID=1028688 RepID=A0A0B7BEA3_9EUPU
MLAQMSRLGFSVSVAVCFFAVWGHQPNTVFPFITFYSMREETIVLFYSTLKTSQY